MTKHLPEDKLISHCLKNDMRAQQELYKRFGRKMYGICLRYAKNRMDADDILQDSFVKVFFHLKDYRSEGSFEGWIRRTVTTTAITHYHKFLMESKHLDIDDIRETEIVEETVNSSISAEEMLGLLHKLIDIQRVVFNLFVMEGYSHKEIGEMLSIPENTSKSHLMRAKKTLQQKINELQNISIIQ